MVEAKQSLGLIKHQATNMYRILSKAPHILNISYMMKLSGQLNIPATSLQRKRHHIDTSLGGPKNQLR